MRILTFICAWIISTGCVAVDRKGIHQEIYEIDKRFFTAFNACDVKAMGNIFSKDLEFYHDLSGYSGYEHTMEVTRSNCDRKLELKRELVGRFHERVCVG